MLGHTSLLSILLLVTLCHNVRSQVPFPNSCPDVKIVESFNLDNYMGTWYEYSKYPFIFEAGQKCQHAVYTKIDESTVGVINTGVYYVINRPNSVSGTAKVIGPGQLAVSFRNQTVEKPNYLILGTDYENWVVVYSCRNITSYGHTKIIWILTRQRIPSEKAVEAAEQVLKDNQLSKTFMIKSTQDDCPSDSVQTNNDDQITSATTEDLSFSSTTAGNIIEVA